MAGRYVSDTVIFEAVAGLPEGEATKERPSLFKNMVHTLNHNYVIDLIWQAHLEGREHGFTARNTPGHPPLAELWRKQQLVDDWYIDEAGPRVAGGSGRRVFGLAPCAPAWVAGTNA